MSNPTRIDVDVLEAQLEKYHMVPQSFWPCTPNELRALLAEVRAGRRLYQSVDAARSHPRTHEVLREALNAYDRATAARREGE